MNLLEIFNKIWEEGKIPESRKIGIVVPIPKTVKNQVGVGNQRPITLVSCLGKTLERMVNRRLMTTLEEIGAIGQDQYEFRRGNGVDTYLAELEEETGSWIRDKQHGELALLDLAKAYDTAERERILRNLHRWGIRGQMGRFIEDFLRDRTFRVSIGETSEIRLMERGVPQGTILAVALFLVRMTEARSYVPRGVTIKLYAYDILLMVHGRSEKVVRKRIQKAVTRIEAWTEHHGFELSTSKSCLIHICRRNRHVELSPVTTDAGPIEVVKHARLQGVTLESRFNFRQHISETNTSTDCMNRILQVIGGHRISGARRTLVRVQQAIVQSKMFYAWGLVSSATPAATQPLGPSHLAGIRSASGAFRTSPAIKAIYAESGELPYQFKACLATLSKAVGLEAGGSIGYVHPLSHRGRVVFEEITGERIPEVAKKRRLGERRWNSYRPKVDWEMTAYVRAGDPAAKVGAAFGVLKEKYRNFTQIFTDGPKEEDFVGCAIV